MKPQLQSSFANEKKETVWHTRKQLQKTEEEVQQINNKLKLLNKEDTQTQHRIEDIKKKTTSLVELKIGHHIMNEQKKMNKKNDEQSLKDQQRNNYDTMKQQQEHREMIKKAMEQIKREEFLKIKELSKKHSEVIQKQRNDFINTNKERREHIKEVMHQSKSNITVFWNDKLGRIQQENEKAKKQNILTNEQQKQLQDRLILEQSYMIQKLQKSHEIQRKLAIELEKNKNLPFDEFQKRIENDEIMADKSISILKLKSNQSVVEQPRWLPTPEKDNQVLIGLETEPKTNPAETSQSGKNKKNTNEDNGSNHDQDDE